MFVLFIANEISSTSSEASCLLWSIGLRRRLVYTDPQTGTESA